MCAFLSVPSNLFKKKGRLCMDGVRHALVESEPFAPTNNLESEELKPHLSLAIGSATKRLTRSARLIARNRTDSSGGTGMLPRPNTSVFDGVATNGVINYGLTQSNSSMTFLHEGTRRERSAFPPSARSTRSGRGETTT